MSRSGELRTAKKDKKDEFYTTLEDIEAEMIHYRDQFRGKIILCNCDDPYESNFFKYFATNFNFLGIKKLIATCYKLWRKTHRLACGMKATFLCKTACPLLGICID